MRIFFKEIIFLQSFFGDVVSIGPKKSIYFLFYGNKIIPVKLLSHNFLQKVDKCFKEELVLKVCPNFPICFILFIDF